MPHDRPTWRERLLGPRDDDAGHRLTRVEGPPVEVHEHFEVQEAPGTPPARAPTPTAPATTEEFWAERDRMFHDHLHARRARRFGAAGLLTAALAIAAAAWLVGGAVLGDGVAPLAGYAAEALLGAAAVVLIVVLAVAWAAARGSGGALSVSWVLGLAGLFVAVGQLANGIASMGLAGLLLASLLAGAGVAVVMACTVALGSVAGRRVQERLLGDAPYGGRRTL